MKETLGAKDQDHTDHWGHKDFRRYFRSINVWHLKQGYVQPWINAKDQIYPGRTAHNR